MATMGAQVGKALESAASEKTWTAKRERRIDQVMEVRERGRTEMSKRRVLNCRDDESLR